MNGFRLSGFLALGIVATLVGGGSVWAEPIISETFYEESKEVQCNTASSQCNVVFSATTSRVLLTNVNCWVSVTSPIYRMEFGVRDTPGFAGAYRRPRAIPFGSPVSPTSSPSTRYYTVSTGLDMMTAPNRYPTIFAQVLDATTWFLSCTISGRIQT
jgi:hypothetical protein